MARLRAFTERSRRQRRPPIWQASSTLTAMSGERQLRSKAEVLAVLQRAGVSEATVAALDAQLRDPVDIDRDANLLLRYGLTLDVLIDRMGGSP
jgi:hypothetical protein